jgi:hypothetical protein
MRKSSAPTRLSFHGNVRPGSPNAWPPTAMLSSTACTASDTTSAVGMRQGARGKEIAVLKFKACVGRSRVGKQLGKGKLL